MLFVRSDQKKDAAIPLADFPLSGQSIRVSLSIEAFETWNTCDDNRMTSTFVIFEQYRSEILLFSNVEHIRRIGDCP